MTTPRFALCSGLLIAVTAGAAALADAHGWWVVFSHSFGGWIERPELSVPAFSWSAYAATVAGARVEAAAEEDGVNYKKINELI